jgi:predicted transglutaminase-like cysteine proteinase
MRPSYDTVEAIQIEVNNSVTYRTDIDLYSTTEFWVEPVSAGDCEDYALAKRKRLLDMGVDSKYLRLATCWTETWEYHAVLIVTTNEGDYVLDNRYPLPMMKQDLRYRWHKIQEGSKWYAIS